MKICIVIPLLLAAVFMQAQSYSSLKLEEIGREISKKCLPKTDSIFNCPEVINGKSLIVTYNQRQEITHLGISLFSNETKDLINSSVCNFIERFMLELVLQKTNNDVGKVLSRFKIKLLKNGVEYGNFGFTSLKDALAEIQNPVTFSLHKNKDQFAAVWEFTPTNMFMMSFPATRDLIFGTDKKESDELLSSSLLDDNILCEKENTAKSEKISEEDLLFDPFKNIFTKKGNTFALPFINSNTYYKKAGDALELIFSEDFPEESLTNLIIRNTGRMEHTLHINHRMYGNFSPDFDISLQKFLCNFQDNYDIFSGISFSDAKEVKLTVILKSKDYNYIHLLLINTSKVNIFKKESVFEADFFSNMPQQNIKNLIGDFKQ